MHPLLEPAPISRAQALERCEKHLRSRSHQFLLVRPLAGENHGHATAVLAYAEALFAANEIPGPSARGRALQEVSGELENVLAGRPQAPLGHALSATIRLKELGPHLFRGPLEELRASLERRTFDSRQALQVHAQRIARPLGRALLSACDHTSEKNEVLMDALATAWLLSRWTVRFRADWDQGRLNVPVDELSRSGIHLQEIDFSKPEKSLRPLIADQVRWIRSLFHKGWELSTMLGFVRGRLLAFLLRWHAASLSALEARRFDVSRGEPPAGVLRWLACSSVSVLTRRPPGLSI